MIAKAAIRGLSRSRATAACSVRTGQYHVHLSKPEIAATELGRNVANDPEQIWDQFGLRAENEPAALNPAAVMMRPMVNTSPAVKYGSFWVACSKPGHAFV